VRLQGRGAAESQDERCRVGCPFSFSEALSDDTQFVRLMNVDWDEVAISHAAAR